MKVNRLGGWWMEVLAPIAMCLFFSLPACGQDCAFPRFVATHAYPVGGVGFSVAVGDFNKDGKNDVAVAVVSATNTLQIFLGNGDGTLQAPINYTPIGSPTTLSAVDLNHDGNLDLVIGGGAQIEVLFGNGDGTFQTAKPIPGTATTTFAFGNLDADTNPDIAYASDIYVTVQKNKGDGTFLTATQYPIGSEESVASIAIGDMNSDGKMDLVIGTLSTSTGHVAVLFGKGDGTFYGLTNTVANLNNSSVAVGDFNRDATQDVAVGDYDTGTVTIFLGKKDGTFQSNAVYTVGRELTAIRVADFNGDGTNDLAVATQTNVMILLGRGDGTFQASATCDGLWLSVAAADFNGDGKLDLATDVEAGSSEIGITLGRGDGTFQTAPHYAVGSNPEFVTIGDLNGDGHPDLVVANFDSGSVSVLLNNGDGTYQPARNYSTQSGAQAVAIGDVNGDGTNDIVVATLSTANAFSVLLNKGNGTFGLATNFGSYGGGPIAVGDFNGDHKLDILVNNLLYGFQVQLGNGKGGFTPASAAAGVNAYGYGPGSLAVGHFNADTNLDFALVNWGQNTVTIGLGKGDGTFKPLATYFAGTNCQAITTGDFNGDGKLDLAVAAQGSASVGDGAVCILLGNGDGTFQPAIQHLVGMDPAFLTCADFNGDGKLDLAVSYLFGFGVGLMLGNGDGTFQPAEYFSSLSDATYASIAVGDLNGDGKPDLALASLANNVAVMLDACTAAAPPLPQLSISPNLSTTVLSWPASFTGFSLEFTTNLASPNWQPVTGSLVTNNNLIRFSIPLNKAQQFFRLRL